MAGRDALRGCWSGTPPSGPTILPCATAATRLTWSGLRRLVDAIAGDLHSGRAEARRAGRGLAAEPGRGGRGVSGLLAPGLCLQPVAAPELHGRRDRGAARAHPRRGAVRATRLRRRDADGRTADIFAACGRAAEPAPGLFARREPPRRRRAVPRRGRCRRCPAARDEPGLGRLSGLHLRHDRDAERRHAFVEHAARQRPRDGRGLGSRSRDDPAQPQPAEPPYRDRRAGRRRWRPAWSWSSTRRPPGRRRSTGSSKPARAM